MIINSYIDIHSHILPGVDDGSSSMEETIEMLKIGHEQGIRCIIATPHYSCLGNQLSVKQLQDIREEVQEEAKKIDEEYEIYLGHELYYSESIIKDIKEKKGLTLADSKYTLVEFSPRESYKTIYKGLREFILAGYAPILAHVERYSCLNHNEKLIRELIELGAYIQMNASSLEGGFLDRQASYHRKLLNNGLIHLIGSDCHGSKIRPPRMMSIVNIVRKKMNDRLVDQIFLDNPKKILENKFI